MSELRVTFDGRLFTFAPAAPVRIGRSSDNDIVVSDPTVSRQHARLSPAPVGWEWQNVGQALTFLDGQPVASFTVVDTVEIRLASPQGPGLRLDVAAAPGQAQGPVKTELAAPIDPPPVATPIDPLPAAAPPGYAVAAPAAAAAVAAAGAQPYQQAAAPQYQQAPPYPPEAVPPGYGAPPPSMPGWPGYLGYAPAPGQAGAAHLDIGSFFQTLIPLRSWLHDRGWRQGLRLLIIPYALLPLLFLGYFSTSGVPFSGDLSAPGWAYSLYVAPLWLLAFWYFIRPTRIGKLELLIAAGIIVWTGIWLHVVTITINDNVVGRPPLTFPKALVVGYNEEITKAIPVLVAALLLLAIRKQKLDPRTWMFMGTIAGLTFGIVEQAIYTPSAIAGIEHSNGMPNAPAVFFTLLFSFRVFVDGFQHAVWAGVSGFFVGMAVNYGRRRVPLLLLGISIPAILHALNDWTLSVFNTVWATVLVQALSLLLFLGYTLSASTIERQVRRDPAFRGQSMLMERFTESGPSPGS